MDLQFKKYKKNEIIYHIEDIPQAIGIVKEGSVVILIVYETRNTKFYL